MERIQSALAKARAARATGSPPPPPLPSSPLPADLVHAAADLPAASAELAAEPPGPAQADPRAARADRVETDARWAALREVRPDPVAFERAHVVATGGGALAAPFDVMRTKMLHQMRANAWKRIAITSPGPSCGKSTIALNLSFGLARQSDLRVVLAEADLRRPTLARSLGLGGSDGTAEVLDGSVDPADVMVRYGANLAVLTAARPYSNPADLFGAPRTAVALDALEARFDPTLTIFDMPPMLVGDDVMAFVGQVDCVLLVAAAESTTIKEIDVCERELATRTNVLGVVLNKCRYLDREQGYGHYG